MNPDVAEVTRAVLGTAARDGSRPPADLDRPLWTRLESSGFTLLSMAVERGGGGGGLIDAATVVHEAAYASAAVPIGEVALIAGPLLDAAGLTAPSGPIAVVPDHGISAVDDDWCIGAATEVPWLRWAETVLVITGIAPHQHLAVIRADAPGLTVIPGANLAGEPRDNLALERTPATLAALPAGDWRAFVAERGALVRAVQLAAAAERVRDQTASYVRTREQFGRPIAAFQAVQHRLVELAGAVTLMRTAVDAALAATEAGEPTAGLLTAIAKAETSGGAGIVAAAGHQLHGAIGFTLEHDLGAATKRLWSWRDEFGPEPFWQEVIADRVARYEPGLWSLVTGVQ